MHSGGQIPCAPATCQQGMGQGQLLQWLKTNKMWSCAALTAWISYTYVYAYSHIHIHLPPLQTGWG